MPLIGRQGKIIKKLGGSYMKSKKIMVMILVGFLFSGCAHVGNVPTLKAQPVEGKTESKAQPVEGKTESVEVEVTEPILNNDVNAARERALMKAQRKAVELVVGVFVNAATLVGKAQLVDSQIYSKTNGYVKKYEVLSETQEGDALKMKLKALVKVGDVNKDLDALGLMIKGATVQNPRIMVLISESIDDAEVPISVCESELAQQFMNTGYRVVESAEVKKIRSLPNTKSAMEGDIQAASKIGQDMKVDVIVIGKAYSTFNTDQGLGGFISYRGTLTAKAIKTDSSEVLFTSTKNSAGADVAKKNAASTALLKSAKIVADEMIPGITKALNERAQVQLTISNIPDFNQLAQLNKFIQSMQGVASTYIRSYGTEKGVASIDINLRYGNAQQIASYLTNIKKFPVEVTAITGNVIEAKAK
ncbi:hypothetical protein COS91_00450 [Candidatus Desantisbacteria bacterium CG07_land_8_20_14_0_80_39_15]|uniref:Flagellar assembly protein T N-terminal domain-containing protein n=2 Tax=unclassified Candidatus Desantisiibacteriota TaxID=3106372 RepID=A0A2H9PB33_9BACT|nr:MAG: hypothetical protein COS91_00450 [Candidatus Desantisbacteria bacterium CG07_land_8_20_14_0_80_39_15]PIZ14907.1 MAG: hypothetical protein COY51_07015 [Candidatus Desantisbacteria bacterium CG_4_10_14_0_8_um_filter_39_17]